VSENPESVNRHDPDINNRFIDIFRAEANKELVRMFEVGLAINDKPAVGAPKPAATPISGHPVLVRPISQDSDQISGIDKDGDQMRVSYVWGATQEYDCDAAVIFRVTEGGFLMPIDRVPGLIAWLQSRVAKHGKGTL